LIQNIDLGRNRGTRGIVRRSVAKASAVAATGAVTLKLLELAVSFPPPL